MNFKRLQSYVLAALFAALVCVATLIVQIPIPATGGFVNLGDCFVLLAGVLLGPVFGSLAAGLGAMLADVITGYAVYAPATFVIKALMALILWLICRRGRRSVLLTVIGAVCAELWMVLGYLLYEAFALGFGKAALAAVPANLLQGGVGAGIAILLLSIIYKNEPLQRFFQGKGGSI